MTFSQLPPTAILNDLWILLLEAESSKEWSEEEVQAPELVEIDSLLQIVKDSSAVSKNSQGT